MDTHDRAGHFHELHREGTFVMANAFDAGSAKLLASVGFSALATTSSGFAATLGRPDMSTDRASLVAHVRSLAEATELPLNVDAERCFPDEAGGVAGTVSQLADAGAAGCSIEDWDPGAARIEPVEVAVARVEEAAKAAARSGLVLTARAENHLRGRDDLGDTIERLTAYAEAGADAVYAPGLVDLATIDRVVDVVRVPLNVLLLPGGPSVAELAGVGVRRVSVGGFLAWVAYGAMIEAAKQLLDDGTVRADGPFLSRELAKEAFTSRGS